MLEEEVESIEDLVANMTADNFVYDPSTIAFFEFAFTNFEMLIEGSESGVLNQVVRDAAADFVHCECSYGMTGLRCDECADFINTY